MPDGGTTTVALDAECIAFHADELRSALLDALARTGDLVLDGSEVRRVDLSALQLLAAAARAARARGDHVIWTGCSEVLSRALRIAGLSQELEG